MDYEDDSDMDREYNTTDPDLEHRVPNPRRHVSHTLYNKPSTKICYFYKDGDVNFRAVRLAINPRRYGNLDNLKKELTGKVKGLPFGVRSVYTPGGHDVIDDLDRLQDNGRYVCSTHRNYAHGVDVGRVNSQRVWRAGRPPSSRRIHMKYLSDTEMPDNRLPPVRARYAWKNGTDKDTVSSLYAIRAPKKITVLRNDQPTIEHVLLLNRRTAQNFEQILDSIGQMFQMPARRLFTLQGRPVKSLSAIFNGPDKYVVSRGGKFQPLGAFTDPGPQAHSITPTTGKKYQNDIVARKLREKRDKLSKTRGKWKVWVSTNDLPSSGTNAQVSLTVYGHKGNSGPIPLGYADGSTFQAGNIDEFEVSVGNIGEVHKIRISHDNSGEFSGWYLNEVRMKDVHTGEQLLFKCGRWLDRDEDDHEICRELPAIRDGEPSLPIVQYEVSVDTGEVWNGGTDANVYITLYGDRGDTGVRQLLLSNRTDKFKKGNTDLFTLEAVSLGFLKRAIIGHDGTAPGDGWFLEAIVVKETPSGMEWIFPCSRWLDEGEDDGKIVRELKPQDEYRQDVIEKQMWEYEKWKYEDHNQIMLYSQFTQRPLRVKQDASLDANGDYTDSFGIFNVIGHRGTVRVLQSAINPKFHLAIDNAKVMGHGRGGAYCEFKVRVQKDRSVILESNKYSVQHINILQNGKPGDTRGSSKDALSDPSRQFFVYCKGILRDQGVVMLCTSLTQTLSIDHNNGLYATGKRNKLAHFKVHKVSDGNIRMFESVVFPKQYIQLKDGKFDVSGKGNVHCHFKVTRVKDKSYITIESIQQKGIFLGMKPEGQIRPTVDTGEKNTRFYLEVITWGQPKGSVGIFQTEVADSPPPVDMKPKKVRKKKRGNVYDKTTPSPAPPAPVQEEPTQYHDGEWKVTITTDEPAQNAQIAMVVYGDHGNSGDIVLGTAGQQGMFLEGNQDQFKIDLSKVGRIYKLRMELHTTSKKKRPEWKIQEVKLQDMTTKETLKFKFQRWLSRTQGNRDVAAELPAIRPGKSVLPVYKYQVTTYTSMEPGADTDANVYVTLFGSRGDTGKRHLLMSDHKFKFQEGQMDTFTIEAVSLGDVTGCLLSHDGSGSGEGWKCDKVVVKETQGDRREFVFPCNKWLDTSMGDGKIERMLKITDPVEVKPRTPTPKPARHTPTPPPLVQREKTPQQDTCDTASSPIFRFTSSRDAAVSPIVNNTNFLSDSCYGYDDIISMDSGDNGLTDSDEDEEERPPPAEVGDYNIWVTTGKEVSMGTTNTVYLVVYGQKGVSKQLTLQGEGQNFQADQTDEFKVNVGRDDLGELYKVRLGHSDIDPKSGWFLEKMKMKNLVNEDVYTFKVNRWLSRSQEDQDVWRELPVVIPGKKPLPVVIYTIEVFTGNLPGSDTEATVSLQLIGQRGDSGKRILYKSQNNDSPFQAGQMDMFKMECVTLEEVTQVWIGHDGEGRGEGWYCDHVIVKEGPSHDAEVYYFPCGQWLDKGMDDNKTERLLTRGEPPKDTRGEFAVSVVTAKDSHKPPDGVNALLTVYGEKGRSRDLQLTNDKQPFKPGQTDTFDVAVGDIGDLYKIRVARQHRDNWKGWHLVEVTLHDKDTSEDFIFHFDRWLDLDTDDHHTVRELAVAREPQLPMVCYRVCIYTGDHWGALTDAQVYITVFGCHGDSGKRYLTHTQSSMVPYRQKQMDEFVLEAVTLDDLEKVIIGHEGEGHGSGWFLERVVIKDDSTQQWEFLCGRWMDDHEDDCKTERELRAVAVSEPPAGVKPGTMTEGVWLVTISTSDIQGAGTHANVSITVYGENGNSGPLPLKGQPDDFEQGKKAEFTVNVGDIGVIRRIRLEHDNSGNFPAWHVHQVELVDKQTHETLPFWVDRWLSETEEDGSLCREITVTRPGEDTVPVLRYYVATYTADVKNSSTTANIFITICGSNGDTGKRPLMDSVTHQIKFLKGQIDVFTIEAGHLGMIDSILLEHNGKDRDSAWMLDKVIIKESMWSISEWLFQCSDWIEPGKYGETAKKHLNTKGQSLYTPLPSHEHMILLPEGSELTQGDWTAWVTSGDDMDTDTNISMMMCGTMATSEPLLLTGHEGKERFKKGAMDEFKVAVDDIGELIKLRLIVSPTGKQPDWNLRQIKLKDTHTKQEFHFEYGRAIRPDGEDKIVELAAVRPDIHPLQEKTYKVIVTTGSDVKSDTEADVYCVLIGQFGDTGKRLLMKTKNGGGTKFRLGQTDEFEITAIDLGKIEKVVVGHTKVGRGKGWYCERVVVMETDDRQLVFPCNKWLDTGIGDREIERELSPLAEIQLQSESEDDKQKPASKGMYKAFVTSADGQTPGKPNSATNSNNNCGNQPGDNTGSYLDLNSNNNNNGSNDEMSDNWETDSDWTDDDENSVDLDFVNDNTGLDSEDMNAVFICTQDIFHSTDNLKSSHSHLTLHQPAPSCCQFLYYKQTTNQNICNNDSDKCDIPSETYCYINQSADTSVYRHTKVQSNVLCVDLNTNNNAGPLGDLDDEGSVTVMVYGSSGEAGPIELNNGDVDMFMPGKQDEFDLHVGDLGDLYKIRVTNALGRPWPLTTIVLQDVHTKEKMIFDFSKFVGESEGDIRKELPVIRPSAPILPILQYHVTIETGDSPGNGQRDIPDMFVRLFGERGDSGSRHLNNLDPGGATKLIQPKQTQLFVLEAVEMLTVNKVILTKGRGASVHVSKVTIKPAEFSPVQWVFKYDSVISDDEDFPVKTEVELVAMETESAQSVKPLDECPHLPQSEGIWNVWTQTGSETRAGTSAQIQLVLCGEKGESPLVDLVPFDSKKTPFQTGEEDQFMIQIKEDLGEITKIRAGFAPTKDFPSWFVESITFEDEATKDEFTVEIHDWLKIDDESDGWKEYPVVWPGVTPPTVLTYKVHTYTGDRVKAGTDANVFIILHGNHGNTGKRHLKKSKNNLNKFEQGQKDEFDLEATDLGDLYKVTIGHDGDGVGSGWFLEQVMVSNDQQEVSFECDRWLDVGEDDGLVERELVLTEQPQGKGDTEPWKVTIETGSDENASTTAPVVLVIYGNRGNSGDVRLSGVTLQPGQTEVKEVKIKADLGEIFKVRVELDTEEEESWQLSKICLDRLKTGETYDFIYNYWVAVTQESDGKIEIPRHHDDPENMLKVENYEVSVRTKDVVGAGTDANVCIQMYGLRGDTGKRQLKYSNVHQGNKFKQDALDIFTIPAVDLGEITSVVLSHDGEGFGSGWYLQDVNVKSQTDTNLHFYFLCDRWLDKGEDDGQIVREIRPSNPPAQAATPEPEPNKDHIWSVMVRNGNRLETGDTTSPSGDSPPPPPTGYAVIVLYGDNGRSENLVLMSANPARFQPLQTEQYQVECPDTLGSLYKVRLGYSSEVEEMNWPVEYVVVKHESTDREYEFVLAGHVTKDATHDGWTELPQRREDEKDMLKVLQYEVEVYTSDVSNAGTDANVTMEIRGHRGDTGPRSLIKSLNHDRKFEQAQMDLFDLEAVDLEEPQEVEVWHDGKGFGAGWHLDKVVITEKLRDKTQYIFMCQRWLDEGEDDASTRRVVKLTEVNTKPDTPREEGEPWTVCVTTGTPPSDQDSHMTGQLTITVYGDSGKTSELALESVVKHLYQPGSSDDFELHIKEHLGTLYKVRLCMLDTPDGDQNWLLHDVKLEEVNTGNNYHFLSDKWVARDDKTDGCHEIPLSQGQDTLPVTKYHLEVYTGDRMGAGTNANVYITIFGQRGDSGCRKLLHSVTYGVDKFEQDHMDLFELEAVDLLELERVIIGHDGMGAGSGWFLNKVVIKDAKDMDKEYVFQCNRWLDVGEDDGSIERELTASPPGDPWTITTITSVESGAGTRGPAVVVIYTDRGRSKPVLIGDELRFTFDDGQSQDFSVYVTFEDPSVTSRDLGEVYKVRVGLTESSAFDDLYWLLDKITLKDVTTNKMYQFELDGRIDLTSTNDSWVEIPVKRDEKMLLVKDYSVEVYTGTESGSGTDSNIYLQICGKRGDTGKRKLLVSETDGNKFETGKMDVFTVTSVDLDKLTKVIIGHDGKGMGSGWHLDKVVIKEKENAKKEVIFPCNRWLDEDSDDKLTERELVPQAPPGDPWTVTTITSTEAGAGTRGPVQVVLYTDRGCSKPVTIGEDEDFKFEDGETQNFPVYVEYEDDTQSSEGIAEVYKVRVILNPTEENNGDLYWILDKLFLHDQTQDRKFTFEFNDRVDFTGDKDGQVEIAVEESEGKLKVLDYSVEVYTGSESGSGTDSNVYLQICGNRGDTGKRKLLVSETEGNKFESGKMDVFTISAVDLDKLTKVIIGHDGKGMGSGWFLDKVVVKQKENAKKEVVFPCGRWLDEDSDDKLTERELVPEAPPGDPWTVTTITSTEAGAGTRGPVQVVLYTDRGRSKPVTIGDDEDFKFEDGETENFPVYVEYEDDAQSSKGIADVYKVRVILNPTGEHGGDLYWILDKLFLHDQTEDHKFTFEFNNRVDFTGDRDGQVEMALEKSEGKLKVLDYSVEVYTGTESGSGTDSNVYLQICGNRGDTGKRKLLVSETDGNKFESGKMDMFTISAVDLDKLTKVIIGHDGKGMGSGWFLDKVVIKQKENAKKEVVFPCGRWLDEDTDDKLTERELVPEAPPGDPWTVTTITSTEAGAGTRGPVQVVLYTDRGRSKPVTIGDDEDFKFEDGETQNFPVYVEYEEDGLRSKDIQDMYKVRLMLNPTGENDGDLYWILDKLLLHDQTQDRKFTFEFNDRVDFTGDKDGQVEMALEKSEGKLKVLDYSVEVYTKEDTGSGTDSNVYFTLCGNRGDTGKRKLLKSETEGNKFEAGKMDVFTISAVDLDKLTKVIIGHDGNGMGSGWFLDKVVVKQKENAKKEVVFPCNLWLDEEADDHLTERELQPEAPPGDPWTVTTLTSTETGAGTRGPVQVVLYTDKGRSKPVTIGEDEDFKFEDGETQNFPVYVEYEEPKVTSRDIEEVYKVRVMLNPTGEHGGDLYWILDKLLLHDQTQDRKFTFEVNDRVEFTGEKDGQVEMALEKSEGKLKVLDYSVEVYTGSESGSGTDSNVYLQICGNRGDTGKRKLLVSETEGDKFENEKMDVFTISAVDLDKLTKVIIGHDGKGMGSGWFLDKVVIKEKENAKREFVFPCKRWLDEDSDDKLTERELPVDQPEGEPWTITMVTDPGSGSEVPGPVSLVFYGEKGHTKVIYLGEEEGFKFKAGEPQHFPVYVDYEQENVSVSNLGEVYKIRLCLDPYHSHDKQLVWKLKNVTIEHQTEKIRYDFDLQGQIEVKDNLDGVVEVPVKTSGEKVGLNVYNYYVEVYTKEESGAGTDSNVHVVLLGSRGDSGVRRLLHTHVDDGDKFESGKMDAFIVPAVDLGDLQKVTIGHDGKGFGSDWGLDRIIVKQEMTAVMNYIFEANRWLKEDEESQEVDLKLTMTMEDPESSAPPSEFSEEDLETDGDWKVLVVTSGQSGGGRDAEVSMTVYGDKGDSGPLPLGEAGKGLFLPGQTDQFDIYIEPDDVGKITKISVSVSGDDKWMVDKITMENVISKDVLEFPIEKVISGTQEFDAHWPE